VLQVKDVLVYNLVTANTVEERVEELAKRKLELESIVVSKAGDKAKKVC
jgi:SNF2 family DNA or RNA helicase